MKVFVASAICLVTMLIIDGIWLALTGRNFYKAMQGHRIPTWYDPGLAYLAFMAVLMYSVVTPESSEHNALRAALVGALFGLFFSAGNALINFLANQATIKERPYLATLVDLAWGATLMATVSCVTVTLSGLIYPAS